MGMLSRTMKKGKKMFGSLCCIDDGKLKPAPEDEKKRKNAQDKSDQNVKNKKRRLPKLFICHDKKPADDDENLTSDQKQQEGDGEKWRRKKKRKRKLVPEAFSPNKKLPPKDETKASSVVAVREGEKRNKKRRRRRLPNVLSRNKKLPKDEISKVSENAPLEYQEQKRKKRRKLVKLFHRNKNKRSEDNLAKTNRQEKDENVKERKMKKIDKKDEDVIVPKDSQEEDEKKNKNNNNSKKSKRRIKASKDGDMASKDSEEEKKHKKKRKRKVLFRKKKTPKDGDTSSKDSEEKEKKHKRKRNILFRKKKAPKDGDTLSKDSEEKEKKSKKKRKRNVLFRKKKTPKDESVAPNDSQKDEKKKKKSNKTSTDENKTLSNAHEDKKEKKKKRRWRRRKMVKIFSRSKKLPKGEKETSRETKTKRKMKIRFWRKKKQTNKTSHLSSLISRMSSISGDNAQQTSAAEILRLGNTSIRARVFSLRELAAATRNFHSDNLLGEGGFGKVFKGQLKDTNETVAVKQLDKNGYQGNKEFLVEVLMLSLLHHPNLVRLVGYCAEGAERILVYEYMPLGSLEDHLLEISPKSRPLDWQTRMKIAAGAARGIEHLHDDTNPPVIYRDLKASNILLDEDFNPKLADFGLAKVGPTGDKTHVSTRVMGTYGYCAPEYALTGQLTKMSDVYSFGVVLLEIITGRRAVDTTKPKKEQILVHWAEPMFKDKRKFDMADPLLEGRYPVKGLCQALAVAAMCLQHEAAIRPLIRDIVTALDYLANPNYETLTGSRESIPRTLPPACSSQAAAAEDTVRTSDDMLVSESTTYPESFSSGYQESDDGIVINLPYPP